MSFHFPENTPFTGAQKMWLQGFLDAIENQAGQPPKTSLPVAAPPTGIPVTIAWGSQTGTAQALAKKFSKKLTSLGHQPKLADMAEIDLTSLAAIGHLLVITSTYGDGEPPDNAAGLHSLLLSGTEASLASLRYSVLALGDSSYPEFCKCGHDFDKGLFNFGATRLTAIVECDVDYDIPFEAWSEQVQKALTAV